MKSIVQIILAQGPCFIPIFQYIDMNDCVDPSLRTGPCCTHTLKKTCLCGASFLRHTDIKNQAIYIYIYTYIYVNVQG